MADQNGTHQEPEKSRDHDNTGSHRDTPLLDVQGHCGKPLLRQSRLIRSPHGKQGPKLNRQENGIQCRNQQERTRPDDQKRNGKRHQRNKHISRHPRNEKGHGGGGKGKHDSPLLTQAPDKKRRPFGKNALIKPERPHHQGIRGGSCKVGHRVKERRGTDMCHCFQGNRDLRKNQRGDHPATPPPISLIVVVCWVARMRGSVGRRCAHGK